MKVMPFETTFLIQSVYYITDEFHSPDDPKGLFFSILYLRKDCPIFYEKQALRCFFSTSDRNSISPA